MGDKTIFDANREVQLQLLSPEGTKSLRVRFPTDEDVIEHRRGFARIPDLPYNRQELTVNLAPASTLYQKPVQATEGYGGAVPIIHQAVAIKAAIGALEASFQEDREANF